jgi:hypothetical protein
MSLQLINYILIQIVQVIDSFVRIIQSPQKYAVEKHCDDLDIYAKKECNYFIEFI